MGPGTHFLRRVTDFFRRTVGLMKRRPAMTEEQLRTALIEGEKSGVVESAERTMVEGVFYLGDRPVGAFMRHRSEIQWFDAGDNPDDVCAKALEYREQRCFPVADENPDEIIGAAYLEDILIDKMTGPGKGLRAIMKKAWFVPQTMPALKAFESFKKARANYIFVMDEYGGFAGMLSIRDLVEEIVGELADNTDGADSIVRQDDGSWLADGGVSIDDVAEELALSHLAEYHSDYHTLAGFILALAGELPRIGDSFAYRDFRFAISGMDGNRIDKVVISKD